MIIKTFNRIAEIISTSITRQHLVNFFHEAGNISVLTYKTFRAIVRYKPNLRGLLEQFFAVGNKSIGIVLLTAFFTGMVLALQFSVSLARFGLKTYSGNVVGLALTRELGPVLTSIMIAARVGSGIAAELGSMVVTEQVRAIEAMGANPIQKLVVPRVVATTIATPLLTILADMVGIIGGLIISVMESGVTANYYFSQIWQTVQFSDFGHGVAKTIFFGFFISIIACYEGLSTKGGTEGVGQSTNKTVVYASMMIFISDFFLTKFFLFLS